jgi:hypothetical protein
MMHEVRTCSYFIWGFLTLFVAGCRSVAIEREILFHAPADSAAAYRIEPVDNRIYHKWPRVQGLCRGEICVAYQKTCSQIGPEAECRYNIEDLDSGKIFRILVQVSLRANVKAVVEATSLTFPRSPNCRIFLADLDRELPVDTDRTRDEVLESRSPDFMTNRRQDILLHATRLSCLRHSS